MLLYWGVFPRAKFRVYLKCPPSLLNFPRGQIAWLTSQNWLTYTHTQICTWGFQFLSLARQTLQLPLIKGGSLKNQPQTSTKTLSEDCTFLNAEAGKNTQNTTHIDVQSELWKAQLNFHHLHQKNQRKTTGYSPWRQQLQFFCAKLLHPHQRVTSSALHHRVYFFNLVQWLFSPL